MNNNIVYDPDRNAFQWNVTFSKGTAVAIHSFDPDLKYCINQDREFKVKHFTSAMGAIHSVAVFILDPVNSRMCVKAGPRSNWEQVRQKFMNAYPHRVKIDPENIYNYTINNFTDVDLNSFFGILAEEARLAPIELATKQIFFNQFTSNQVS